MTLSLTARVCLMVTAALSGACSAPATIYRRSGPTLVATIDRSDQAALYVTTPSGPRYLVGRADVVDIDHPGPQIILTGASSLAAGLLLLAATYSGENPSGFVGIPRLFAWTGIVIGLPMTVGGTAEYFQSRGRAGSFAGPTP